MEHPSFFCTTALGLEDLLQQELETFGATDCRQAPAGVSFQGELAVAYRACLWSRFASRVFMPLATYVAEDKEALYRGAQEIAWEAHLDTDLTFAVDANVTKSKIDHSQFAALVVKDAIVDRCRDHFGERPSVERQRPSVKIYLHLRKDQATVGIDLSGESLHQRGYRHRSTEAPLKESLAAAILARLRWTSEDGYAALIDPMCGSGTLLIEAAMMAADIAPGLLRTYYGFIGWKGHQPDLWQQLRTEAEQRREEGLTNLPSITGFDRDPRAIVASRANIDRAGLSGRIQLVQQGLSELSAPHEEKGLLVVNPPYGERLGELPEVQQLYRLLGEKLRTHFTGWRAGVFTSNEVLGQCLGIRAKRVNALYNGAIKCLLFGLELDPKWYRVSAASATSVEQLGEGAQSLANRLRKNRKRLKKWIKQETIECYRLYDADLPEYAMAIDLYRDWVHLQEYAPPSDIPEGKARRRVEEAVVAVAEVMEIPRDRVVVKVRQRQRGRDQYRRQGSEGERMEVTEYGCRFGVNLTDYLDTGLFLDHRPIRHWIQQNAAGKRFLNLFGYTGAATVHAAKGGAVQTVTVDLSHTYLQWAKDNLRLNGLLDGRHRFEQADCRQWIEQNRDCFDLIFLDPPTFSNSKRMEGDFDIQRDHVSLIQSALNRLDTDGTLIFSTNHRRFKLDEEAFTGVKIIDMTRDTIPPDFARNTKIHRCWRFERLSSDDGQKSAN